MNAHAWKNFDSAYILKICEKSYAAVRKHCTILFIYVCKPGEILQMKCFMRDDILKPILFLQFISLYVCSFGEFFDKHY